MSSRFVPIAPYDLKNRTKRYDPRDGDNALHKLTLDAENRAYCQKIVEINEHIRVNAIVSPWPPRPESRPSIEAILALGSDLLPHLAAEKDWGGFLPLHNLCSNPNVTVPLVELVASFYPAAAAKKIPMFYSEGCGGAPNGSCGETNNAARLPLHFICQNRFVTPELVRAVFRLHPAAATERTHVHKGNGNSGPLSLPACTPLDFLRQNRARGARACEPVLCALMESIGVAVPAPSARLADPTPDLISFGGGAAAGPMAGPGEQQAALPPPPPLATPQLRRQLSDQGRRLFHAALLGPAEHAPADPQPAGQQPPASPAAAAAPAPVNPRSAYARSNSAILRLYD